MSAVSVASALEAVNLLSRQYCEQEVAVRTQERSRVENEGKANTLDDGGYELETRVGRTRLPS